MARILTTVGLFVQIIGCLLLYRFGLAADVDPSGAIHIITEQRDEAEVAKGKRYRKFGRFGIILVAIGSVLQVFAAWVPR